MSQHKFNTLLGDPPWSKDQRGNYGAIKHYDLMTLERIKAMPVADLTEENAHCYLWVTNGTMKQGHEVLETWGFQVKGILTWIKPRIGLGNYLRNNTEHLLLGVKGRTPVLYNRQPTWFYAPQQEHSHKPEEQFAIIERLSPGPYLELFARRKQPGWSAWGNEVNSDISIPGYPVPSDNRKELDGE